MKTMHKVRFISALSLAAAGVAFVACAPRFRVECPEGKIRVGNGDVDEVCKYPDAGGAGGSASGMGSGGAGGGVQGSGGGNMGGAAGQMSGPPPGSFDATFGEEGKVRVPLMFAGQTLGQLEVKAIRFQSSGKIIVAGMAHERGVNGTIKSFLARFDQSGELDLSFGNGAGYIMFRDSKYAMIRGIDAMEIVPGDKIVAVGYTDSPGNEDYATILARFNADGTPDSSFLSQPVEPALGNYFVTRISSGKLLVAGNYKLVADIYPPTHFYAFRFDENGSVDVDFQKVEISGDSGGISGPESVTIDSQGNFFVGMSRYGDFASVARLGPTGAPDLLFGENGNGSHFENWGRGPVNGIAVHSDGSVVLAGSVAQSTGGGSSAPQPTPALVRYVADGTRVDSTFGSSGLVLGVPGGNISGWSCVMILPDEKIVAAGSDFVYTGVSSTNKYISNAARFLRDGTPDLEFGSNSTGSISMPEGSSVDRCLLDELGRVVVVGHSLINDTLALDVARFWN